MSEALVKGEFSGLVLDPNHIYITGLANSLNFLACYQQISQYSHIGDMSILTGPF